MAKVVKPAGIESEIGSNVAYAAVHEYGFDGDVQVKAHTRKITHHSSNGSVFEVKTGRISKAKTKSSSGGVAQVKAFTRHMKMPARRYIGSMLEERSGDYTTEISQAILSAWNGGKS